MDLESEWNRRAVLEAGVNGGGGADWDWPMVEVEWHANNCKQRRT
jgi:hypothetical protein